MTLIRWRERRWTIPAADNTQEVAWRAAPHTTVVYVDNDPIVLTHARALLASHPSGPTDYIDADLRDPAAILAEAARTLDFASPLAIMLIGVLHCISDADDPHRILATLIDAVPPGSYLAISHPASDIHAREMAAGSAMMNKSLAAPVTFRPQQEDATAA